MKFEAKVDKREEFVAQCKKGGMPKYYKLKFDKPALNYYLQTDARDSSYKDKLSSINCFYFRIIIIIFADFDFVRELDIRKPIKRS